MCKISVVMSVFNGGLYLQESIKSILYQTFEDFEFIIINDGSSDNSFDIIKSYRDNRIILVNNENNNGLSAALNRGILAANGNFIARMDADDISYPERLKRQLGFLQMNPDCVAVGSNVDVIDQDGKHLFTSNLATDWVEIKKMLPETPFYHSSTMYRKDIALKCGLYDVNMLTAQDVVFFNSMSRFGSLYNISEPLIRYRLSSESISLRSKKDTTKIMNIVRDRLDKGSVSVLNQQLLRKIYSKKRNSRYKKGYYYLMLGKHYIEKNFSRNRAFLNLINSIRYIPFNIRIWYNLLLLILPLSIINTIKRQYVK